jgi:hypothetical protein
MWEPPLVYTPPGLTPSQQRVTNPQALRATPYDGLCGTQVPTLQCERNGGRVSQSACQPKIAQLVHK